MNVSITDTDTDIHIKCYRHASCHSSVYMSMSTIMLDPRLSFTDSVAGIFPGPATTQKVCQGIEWFSQLAGLQ